MKVRYSKKVKRRWKISEQLEISLENLHWWGLWFTTSWIWWGNVIKLFYMKKYSYIYIHNNKTDHVDSDKKDTQ